MDKLWSSIPVPDSALVLVEFHRFFSRKYARCSDKCNGDGARTLHFSTGFVQRDPGKLEERQLPQGSGKKLHGVTSTPHFQHPRVLP